MKAIVCTAYGPPEVLQLREVAKPTPRENDVLIRMYATAVAIEDVMMRRSSGPQGFGKPRKTILGTYVAGEVEAVGRRVKRFEMGDQVFGFTGFFGRLGAYAEYACMSENGCLIRKPANTTYEEAAAIPNGGLTALPFLRDVGRIRSGQRVLVYGASGAVGTAAVQLARYYGAEVTGVCSGANLELVRSLGAGTVVDYTKEDFTQNHQTYDIIFDAVGKISFPRCKNSLAPRGVYLTTVPMPETVLHMLRTLLIGGKKVRFAATGLMPTRRKRRDLTSLRELVETGKLKAVIDRVYPLKQIAEAHRYVEKGHKKGNVIITVGNRNKGDRE